MNVFLFFNSIFMFFFWWSSFCLFIIYFFVFGHCWTYTYFFIFIIKTKVIFFLNKFYMFDFSILCLFNSTSVVVILLWLLTNFGNFFFTKKEKLDRFDFYECGFKSVNDFRFRLNCGTLCTVIFVVLYDIELLFTIPMYFYIDYSTFEFSVNVVVLFFTILLTFIIDITEESVLWNF